MSTPRKANPIPSKSLGAQSYMKKKGKPLLNLLCMVLICEVNLHEDWGGDLSENEEDEDKWLGPYLAWRSL